MVEISGPVPGGLVCQWGSTITFAKVVHSQSWDVVLLIGFLRIYQFEINNWSPSLLAESIENNWVVASVVTPLSKCTIV